MHFSVRWTQETDHVGRGSGAQTLILGFLELSEQFGGLIKFPLEHFSFCEKNSLLKTSQTSCIWSCEPTEYYALGFCHLLVSHLSSKEESPLNEINTTDTLHYSLSLASHHVPVVNGYANLCSFDITSCLPVSGSVSFKSSGDTHLRSQTLQPELQSLWLLSAL